MFRVKRIGFDLTGYLLLWNMSRVQTGGNGGDGGDGGDLRRIWIKKEVCIGRLVNSSHYSLLTLRHRHSHSHSHYYECLSAFRRPCLFFFSLNYYRVQYHSYIPTNVIDVQLTCFQLLNSSLFRESLELRLPFNG